MLLKKIEYFEFQNDKKYWALKPFELGKINLFAAKNATGKTRTLKVIDTLSCLIPDKSFKSQANYNVEFIDGSDVYSYGLEIKGRIVTEQLLINNTAMITRDATGRGKIFAAREGKNIEFQSPEGKLVISRRDMIQYPYLEKIHEWAENVRFYPFGSSMNQEYGKAIEDKNTVLDGNSDNSVEVFVVGELEFDNKFKENVLSLMNSIGYELSDIDAQRWQYLSNNIRSEDYTLYVSEKDRDTFVVQKDMSQGMFRALSVIIHLSYHVMMKTPVTILIDDIGEGLDFDRSSKLIKLLIDLAEKNDNIQLIMSTNDRFVMNNVPLEYWQVIHRNGGECQVFNYKNSRKKFDEFKYMGLNNFDFLATDYINSEWEKT
ncbi:MAG: ATP-binding protein [Treponema sp.]|jgi:energy-coupling factor transporter ATP-binding protein EcfA2|nr:ATP-binding protein [Treponema sp.]